ncbi:Mitochondrial substrate carrier family protein [Euphorbia peplus]|nr:Mitochondrial substrate carrier family protein [Euphorbia peplus]
MEEDDTAPYKKYLAGFLAGISTVITGHPFDTVKVKLQNNNAVAHGIKYSNGLHCAATILQTEGVKGLYRGATSSFVGVAVESSILFGVYSQTKQYLQLQGGVRCDVPMPRVIIPSAVCAGSIISFILCPVELLKCRMQIQGTGSSRRYTSPLDCALQTVKSDGVSGVFRGGLTTFLRESIGSAVFFSVYEYVRYYMHSQLKSSSSKNSKFLDMGIGIMSGGLGGVVFWSAVLPLDVAKTMIQTTPDKSTTRNPFQVLDSIYRRKGIRGCYAGLGATILRAFPANAAAIVTWELAMKMLGIKHAYAHIKS